MRKLILIVVLGLAGCSHKWDPNWDKQNTLPSYSKNYEQKHYEHIVVKYAPILYQYTSEDTRVDFPANFNFDNKRVTCDNHDNLYKLDDTGKYKYDLEATVYYSIVATRSHYYLTYFIYHARDYAKTFPMCIFNGWAWASHENDGESIQIVVQRPKNDKKGDGKIIAVGVQAHGCEYFYLGNNDKINKVNRKKSSKCVHLFKDTKISSCQKHLKFLLEPGKHGIYVKNLKNLNTKGTFLPKYSTESKIMVFSPTKNFKSDGDYWNAHKSKEILKCCNSKDYSRQLVSPIATYNYNYRFQSIEKELWNPYTHNRDTGCGGVMEGSIKVSLERENGQSLTYERVPQVFNSDELSALPILKFNSGIMPFRFGEATDYGKGSLFFDPAYYYRDMFKNKLGENTVNDWSITYTYNPYLTIKYLRDTGSKID